MANGAASANPTASDDAVTLDSLLDTPWKGIRPDLVVHLGPTDTDGQPTWVLEDPLRGTNYLLGYVEGRMIEALARSHSLEDALTELRERTSLRVTLPQVLEVVRLLQRERLANLDPDYLLEVEKQVAAKGRPSRLRKLLHQYLYFRVPLTRPDGFLSHHLSKMQTLWHPWLRWLYLLIGMMGVALTLPQIELYFGTVNYLLTAEGATVFAVTIVLLKVAHELSHAFTAKAQGLHVRAVGVAFIVLWPVMYTDSTASWKLHDRRKRLYIDAAGVTFELVVAGIALFFWALLPDGLLRSVMFFLSSVSIASSLAINLNPFMRFDGYYILMDLWGIDNLQPRAFDQFKSVLRRRLWDWQGEPPERLPRHRQVITYAMLTMLYRVSIAIAIGLAVYHMLFKELGLVVFLFELWSFVFKPVWGELAFVNQHRENIGSRWKITRTWLVILGLISLLFVPYSYVETYPSLVVNQDTTRVQAPLEGALRGELPKMGDWVEEGTVLAELTDPVLAHRIEALKLKLSQTDERLLALDSAGAQGGYRNWLVVERERLVKELQKYQVSATLRKVLAPVSGTVTWVNNDLYSGAYVAKGARLLVLSKPERFAVRAYVHESKWGRVPDYPLLKGQLHCPDLETDVIEMTLASRSRFPVLELPNTALLDRAGGPILSVEQKDRIVPRDAHFVLTFRLPEDAQSAVSHLPNGMPCKTWVQGKPRSLFSAWVEALAGLFAGEGFI